jgi:hypothetical protein
MEKMREKCGKKFPIFTLVHLRKESVTPREKLSNETL